MTKLFENITFRISSCLWFQYNIPADVSGPTTFERILYSLQSDDSF